MGWGVCLSSWRIVSDAVTDPPLESMRSTMALMEGSFWIEWREAVMVWAVVEVMAPVMWRRAIFSLVICFDACWSYSSLSTLKYGA